MNIVESSQQNKEWRKNQEWYYDGKHNECEKYQINLLDCKIEKTQDRINLDKNKILNNRNPLKNNDGYEYTENFLKMIRFIILI